MRGNSTLRWVFLAVAILLAITFGFKACKHEVERQNARTEIVTLPNTVIEYKLLVEGAKPIRVQKDGYRCEFYGGGKQYYNQPQNSTKEVWGGGACPSNLNFPNASYSDLSYYKEEVTVKCVFTLKK